MRHRAGPIAVDFGSYALRVAQLAGREGRWRVLAAACHVYPPAEQGDMPDGLDRPVGLFRGRLALSALAGLLRQHRFIGREVVTALNEPALRIKNIRLPEMPEAEVPGAVRYEALERIPGLDEAAEVRFLPAGVVAGSASGSAGQHEVIVLAAESKVVRGHLEMLSELGLHSAGMDAPPCAVFRPFERFLRREEDREQVNVFLDLGWSGTRITLTRGDQMVFTRSFEVGGARFSRLVAERLSVEPAEAERLRRQVSELGETDGRPGDRRFHNGGGAVDARTAEAVKEATRAGLEQLGKEISLCLRYYAVTFRGRRADTVTCVGGESLDRRQLETLSEILGLPCRVGFPLRGIPCTGAMEGRQDGSLAEWATAIGLAMKPVHCTVEEAAR